MVDIFDEVSDDLRSERALRLLARYGFLAVAAAVLIVLAVAAQQFYAWHQARQSAAAATAFLAISTPLDKAGTLGNPQRLAAARQLTDFAKTAPAGYRALADLRAAGLLTDAGQTNDAARLWNTVAADAGAEPLLRDLANLLWAQHELGVAPDADISARLAPLAAAQSPWHGLAQETQALLYLHEGKTDQAKGLFSQIAADPGAPDGARNRADGLLAKLNG